MVHFPVHERTLESQFIDHIAQLLLQVREKIEQCQLLGNTFEYLIQFILGFIAFLSLVYKRWTEVPRRPWGIWGRDAAKQALGSLAAHVLNILFALHLQKDESENPCVLYLINFVVDSSLGCLFNYFLLVHVIEVVAERCASHTMITGYYGDPPSNKIWALQVAAWIFIVTVVKVFLLFALLIPLKNPLYAVGKWSMSGFDYYPKMELVIVMVLVPLVMNILVFWIQDNFLMDNSRVHRFDLSLDPDLDQQQEKVSSRKTRSSGDSGPVAQQQLLISSTGSIDSDSDSSVPP